MTNLVQYRGVRWVTGISFVYGNDKKYGSNGRDRCPGNPAASGGVVIWSRGPMILSHLRYAIRRLLREPILALAATATLALCIGANTTVFSLVNSVLLRPLPYPDSERICWITEDIGRNRTAEVVMAGDYYSISEESRIFDSVAAFDTSTL